MKSLENDDAFNVMRSLNYFPHKCGGLSDELKKGKGGVGGVPQDIRVKVSWKNATKAGGT